MSVDRFLSIAMAHLALRHPGAFYGQAGTNAPGAGMIFADLPFPRYNFAEESFDVVEGLAYILTHECDIDQGNDRPFNDLLVVCPIIPMINFVNSYVKRLGEDSLTNFIAEVAKGQVFRLFFLPPSPALLGIKELALGGIMYLNQLTNTHVRYLSKGARPIGALSSDALRVVDSKFQNHFFRPKQETLPLLR